MREKISLDEQRPEQKVYMDKILNFVLVIVKRTLCEKDYKQVGRLPRFFNPEERKEVA
jgi:hypothetical protein